jgi:hypothetical protein
VAENVQLDLDGTVSVTLAEAAISAESRLKGLRNSQLFSIENNTVDGDFVRAMQTDLQGFGGDGYLLDGMAGACASLAASGQALQPLADWIAGKFLSSRNGTRSDAWISALFIQSYEMRCFVPAADVAARQAETEAWAEFLLLCPDWFTEAEIPGLVQGDIERRHQVRIATLPGAVAAIGSDASLLLPDTDSDADSLSNTAEINVPLVEASLPWLADSDLDGIIDSSDDCPADPLNLCSSNPLLPVLTVGFDVFVSEPESGSGVVIISIVLNRSVDMPVTVEYRAFIDVGDTAEGGTDFLEVSGIQILAANHIAQIRLPKLPNKSQSRRSVIDIYQKLNT